MKKAIKNLIFILLSVVYCLAMNTAGHNSVSFSSNTQSELTGKTTTLLSKTADRLFLATAELKLPGSTVKNTASNNPVLPRYAILNAATNYVHFTDGRLGYLRYAKTLLVRFRKADLIFPFHYFW